MSQTITVEGMSCEHCEQSVTEALEGVDGVESATADRESKSATVVGRRRFGRRARERGE